MHEQDCTAARKNEIGFARKVSTVETIAKARGVHDPPDGKLGSCVLAAYACHISAAGFGT
ncbi:hypothetical protein AOQ71_21120 [Bradyrhizobium manausense]|uniref:Uncharacterized protein n=1 Tax=Bradyrhizobium manausense TaxID=989370 RepID=A0A0R3DL70_9BRAD|nr:hypothetical protein AOQ71_21120 [Bradyrhizobium manausense]